MARKLTQRLVNSAKAPKNAQILIRDSEVRGFALRITPNGCKTWVWDGRIDGLMRRITIARCKDIGLTEARAEALGIRHDIAVGLDPARERQEERMEVSLSDVAGRYLDGHSRVHKRSWREEKRIFQAYFHSIASQKLSILSREAVSSWHQRIGIEHGRYQANRCVALLSALYSWALRFGHWKGESPAKGIKHFQEKSRSRFLSSDELTRVWAALDSEPSSYHQAYFKLALLLGMRKNELLSARWQDINLQERIWKLPTTKNGTSHTLPIPHAATQILESMPSRENSDWLFPSNGNENRPLANVNHAWTRIRNRAGVPDVRIHDLRRTLGSWLAAQGCSLPLIGKALNHSNVATTQIYARLNLDPVREALERNASLMLDRSRMAPRYDDPTVSHGGQEAVES